MRKRAQEKKEESTQHSLSPLASPLTYPLPVMQLALDGADEPVTWKCESRGLRGKGRERRVSGRIGLPTQPLFASLVSLFPGRDGREVREFVHDGGARSGGPDAPRARQPQTRARRPPVWAPLKEKSERGGKRGHSLAHTHTVSGQRQFLSRAVAKARPTSSSSPEDDAHTLSILSRSSNHARRQGPQARQGLPRAGQELRARRTRARGARPPVRHPRPARPQARLPVGLGHADRGGRPGAWGEFMWSGGARGCVCFLSTLARARGGGGRRRLFPRPRPPSPSASLSSTRSALSPRPFHSSPTRPSSPG